MTSVLRRMTGPLCDAVVGREGSGKLLRELARSNLFVVPLDEQGEWYRYHHLFSDMLLYELKSSRPELLPVLHGRASAWSEDAGFFDSAIRHAIAAKDYERASMLIARHWFAYVFTGQTGDRGTMARVVTRRFCRHRRGACPSEGVDVRPLRPEGGDRALPGSRRERPSRRTASRRNCLGRGGCSLSPRRLRLRWRQMHGRGGPECRGVGVRADLAADGVGVSRLGA